MKRFIPDAGAVARLRERAGSLVERTAGAARRLRERTAPVLERAHAEVRGTRERAVGLARRARGHAAPFVVALALMAPMGGFLISRAMQDAPPETVEADARVARAGAASAGGGTADGANGGTSATAGSARTDASVASGWRAKALEREREAVAEEFAERFGISVPLAQQIHDAAVEERIDPDVAFGLVRTESSFRRTVVSWAGAVGYTQLLPSTARWIAPGTSRGDLFDTRTNLRVGFKYLRYLMDKYDGNTRLALLAYNRGPGTVDRVLSRGGNPANGYADKVLRG